MLPLPALQLLLLALPLAAAQSLHIAVPAVLAILLGGFMLVSGFRLFRPTLFVAGFAFTALVGFVILTRAEPTAGYANRDTVLLLGSLAFGIAGGFLALLFWQFGVSCLGAMAGVAVALFVLSWKSNGAIESETGRAIFIAVCALIGAVVIHFVERPAIIVSTSVLGAYLVIMGIDFFAKTGVVAAIRQFLSGTNRFDTSVFSTSNGTFGMLCTMVVLAVIGIIVQFRTTIGRDFMDK
ncbi:hypothetical protein HK105_202608 [Polyrhizophydium stewartii]|uniref:Transmembrane protein 198 n=1 Tax=Polyrhizophydium stewartii TaxID=2732419 RepID=A0ABR4NDX6_9FUNG|nr:hypothetical protein HK105_000037 [Polyrhizophydium stewartii]